MPIYVFIVDFFAITLVIVGFSMAFPAYRGCDGDGLRHRDRHDGDLVQSGSALAKW